MRHTVVTCNYCVEEVDAAYMTRGRADLCAECYLAGVRFCDWKDCSSFATEDDIFCADHRKSEDELWTVRLAGA